jgi:hypothetical protein
MEDAGSVLGRSHPRDPEGEDDNDPGRARKRQKLEERETQLIKAAKPKPSSLGTFAKAVAIVLKRHPKLYHSMLYERVASFLDYIPSPWRNVKASTTGIQLGLFHQPYALYGPNRPQYIEEIVNALYDGMQYWCSRIDVVDSKDGCIICHTTQPPPPMDLVPSIASLVDEEDNVGYFLDGGRFDEEAEFQYFCTNCNPKALHRLGNEDIIEIEKTWKRKSQTLEWVFRDQTKANRAYIERVSKHYGSLNKAILALRDKIPIE